MSVGAILGLQDVAAMSQSFEHAVYGCPGDSGTSTDGVEPHRSILVLQQLEDVERFG